VFFLGAGFGSHTQHHGLISPHARLIDQGVGPSQRLASSAFRDRSALLIYPSRLQPSFSLCSIRKPRRPSVERSRPIREAACRCPPAVISTFSPRRSDVWR
jgi:hypothetical protein